MKLIHEAAARLQQLPPAPAAPSLGPSSQGTLLLPSTNSSSVVLPPSPTPSDRVQVLPTGPFKCNYNGCSTSTHNIVAHLNKCHPRAAVPPGTGFHPVAQCTRCFHFTTPKLDGTTRAHTTCDATTAHALDGEFSINGTTFTSAEFGATITIPGSNNINLACGYISTSASLLNVPPSSPAITPGSNFHSHATTAIRNVSDVIRNPGHLRTLLPEHPSHLVSAATSSLTALRNNLLHTSSPPVSADSYSTRMLSTPLMDDLQLTILSIINQSWIEVYSADGCTRSFPSIHLSSYSTFSALMPPHSSTPTSVTRIFHSPGHFVPLLPPSPKGNSRPLRSSSTQARDCQPPPPIPLPTATATDNDTLTTAPTSTLNPAPPPAPPTTPKSSSRSRWLKVTAAALSAYHTLPQEERAGALINILSNPPPAPSSKSNGSPASDDLPVNPMEQVYNALRDELDYSAPDFQKITRCLRELAHGQVSRALRVLTSEPPLDPSCSTTADLIRSKYNHGPVPLINNTPPPDASHVPTLNPDDVFRLLMTTARGKGAGPDGTAAADFQDVLTSTSNGKTGSTLTSAVKGLTAICQDIANGIFNFHPTLQPLLTTARGVALPKPGSVRPLGILPFLVLLATRAVMCTEDYKRAIPARMGPGQLSMGVRGGIEAAPAILNATRASNPDYSTVALDIFNAFNEALREHTLSVRDTNPALDPLLHLLYSRPNKVVYTCLDKSAPPVIVTATRGNTQGSAEGSDTFNTLLFREVVSKVQEEFPNVIYWGICDDTYLSQRATVLIPVIRCFIKHCARIGLTITLRKSKFLFGPSTPEEDKALLRAFSAEHGLAIVDGLVIAGIPVGSPSFINAHLTEAFSDIHGVIALVSRAANAALLHHRHTVMGIYKILRYCLSAPKVNHYLRALPRESLAPFLPTYDRAMFTVTALLATLSAPYSDPLTNTGSISMARAQLAPRLGGLGLSSACASHPAQRMGHIALVSHIITSIVPGFTPTLHAKGTFPDIDQLFTPSLLRSVDAIKDYNPLDFFTAPVYKLARAISAVQSKLTLPELLGRLPDDESRAWLVSNGGTGGLVLHAAHNLPNSLAGVLLRTKLGAPASASTPPAGPCHMCGKPQNGSGTHYPQCMTLSQSKGGPHGHQSRHSAGKGAIKALLAEAIRANSESGASLLPCETMYKEFLDPKVPGMPPDTRTDIHLSFPLPGGGTLHLVCDFTVAHPDGSSHTITFPDGSKRSLSEAYVPGVASEVASRNKFHQLNKDFNLASGHNFTVTVGAMETGGRSNKNLLAFCSTALKQICGIVSGSSHQGHLSPTFRYAIHLNKLIEATVVAVVKFNLRTMLAITANYDPKGHDRTLSRGTASQPITSSKRRVQISSSLPASSRPIPPPTGAAAPRVGTSTSLPPPRPPRQQSHHSPPLVDDPRHLKRAAEHEEEMCAPNLEAAAILYLQGSQDSGATPEVSPDLSWTPPPVLGAPSLLSAAAGTPPAASTVGAPLVGVG